MAGRWVLGARIAIWVLLGAGGLALLVAPAWAPALVLAALASAFWPLARAWREARGTPLRSAIVWAGITLVLGMVAQGVAMGESPDGGRPAAGHWAYLATLTTLASLISVLNARRPGSGAWALLMGLLVLVFLIPWLEGAGLSGQAGSAARLRLETPWTLFFLLLVVVGVTNYLPTPCGLASLWLALGLVLEYAALTRVGWPPGRRALVWSAVPWTVALAIVTADALSRRAPEGRPGLERLWFWFRDRWGVVWALRIQERFNRNAELLGWPVRLGWYGVVPAPGLPGLPASTEETEAALKGLLRRFADPARLAEAAGRPGSGPCQREGIA